MLLVVDSPMTSCSSYPSLLFGHGGRGGVGDVSEAMVSWLLTPSLLRTLPLSPKACFCPNPTPPTPRGGRWSLADVFRNVPGDPVNKGTINGMKMHIQNYRAKNEPKASRVCNSQASSFGILHAMYENENKEQELWSESCLKKANKCTITLTYLEVQGRERSFWNRNIE